MAGQVKFCRSCGKQIDANAKFCRYCGFRFETDGKEPRAQAPAQERKPDMRDKWKQSFEAGKARGRAFVNRRAAVKPTSVQDTAGQNAESGGSVCPACGSPVTATAKFCLKCGSPIGKSSAQGAAAVVLGTVAAAAPVAAAQFVPQLQNGGRVAASDTAGEVLLGQFDKSMRPVSQAAAGVGAAVTSARARADEILSPIKTLLGGAKNFLSGLAGAVRDPRTLIPTLLMAAAWIVLPLLQRSAGDNAVVRLLSWLTFANGGAEREGLGLLGDIVGKGGTAVALSSLFNGGLRSAANGVRALFSHKGKGNAAHLAIGAVVGTVTYLFCSGPQMNAGATMAGISGALLSLQGLGSGSGFFHTLAESLTAGKANGVRAAREDRACSLLGGSALGFAAVTAISALL